jgi:acyl carrier protein
MNTLEKVKQLFADQLSISEDEITLESDIFQDLHADSLDLYILISSFNDEFGITVPDDEVKGLTTIGAIVEYIDSKTA